MASLEFVPLGVGDAFSAQHYSTCLALRCGEAALLIDCPHPIRKMLREADRRSSLGLDADDFDGVLITHLHGDHVSGLEGLVFFNMARHGRKTHLITHGGVLQRIWTNHLSASMDRYLDKESMKPLELPFDTYFEVSEMIPEQSLELGPFKISCRPTVHHIPTMAVRVEAAGRMLGYSADTIYDEELIDWLCEADLVVHEANLGLHTPYEKLAALPAEKREKLRLIHLTDDFDRQASIIEVLEEGKRYRV